MGANPYEKRSRDEIVEELATGGDFEDRPAMWLGRVLEPYVAQKALELYPQWRLEPCSKLLRSTRWPWLMATPDGIRWRSELGARITEIDPSEIHVGDIKCHDRYTSKKWADGVPEMYRIQIHVQAAVYGARFGFCLEQDWGAWPRYHDVEIDTGLVGQIVTVTAAAWRDVCDIRESKNGTSSNETTEAIAAR